MAMARARIWLPTVELDALLASGRQPIACWTMYLTCWPCGRHFKYEIDSMPEPIVDNPRCVGCERTMTVRGVFEEHRMSPQPYDGGMLTEEEDCFAGGLIMFGDIAESELPGAAPTTPVPIVKPTFRLRTKMGPWEVRRRQQPSLDTPVSSSSSCVDEKTLKQVLAVEEP